MRSHFCLSFNTSPCKSACNCSGRSAAAPVAVCAGQANAPLSRRLVHSHSPEPSQYSAFNRLRRLFVKRNKCPETGSSRRWFFTHPERPSNPKRRSAGRVATNTRVAGDNESISAKPPGKGRPTTEAKPNPKAGPPIPREQSTRHSSRSWNPQSAVLPERSAPGSPLPQLPPLQHPRLSASAAAQPNSAHSPPQTSPPKARSGENAPQSLQSPPSSDTAESAHWATQLLS